MLNSELVKIFDSAFCEVTKKLVKLELEKVNEEKEEGDGFLPKGGCLETIETYGYMNAKIVCWFSDELFQYIIEMMNRGTPPPEDEIPLFLNEYINITCGYAVSKLNNLSGHYSRLSIPKFHQEAEELEEKWKNREGMYLAYRTKLGGLDILMRYSFQSEQEEVV